MTPKPIFLDAEHEKRRSGYREYITRSGVREHILQQQRERYAKHREQRQAAAAKWRKEHPEYGKNYRKTHKEYHKQKYANWRNNNKEYHSKRVNEWMDKHPEVSLAQYAANRGLGGYHPVPMAKWCEVCPEDDLRAATQRHHPDYNYPTIIVSCCQECHTYLNRERSKKGMHHE